MAFKLLLADDSVTIQKVVELILAGGEWVVKSVGNGREALEVMASFQPDVVLADTDMPTMNGYELCAKIKEDPAMSSTPVILLIGAFEPLDEERARRVKADDSLMKPFEAQELTHKLTAALALRTAPAEPSVSGETLPLPEEATQGDEIWQVPEAALRAGISEAPGDVSAASTEQLSALAEEVDREPGGAESVEEAPREPTLSRARAITVTAGEFLSREEIRALFEDVIRERVSALLSPAELKETLIASISPFIKDSVDKILWDLTPELIERMLKEILKGSIESLTSEVQKVIWETVPELAETMISQEIERIKSAF